VWDAGPLTVKRGLLGAAGVPAYQFDGAAVGSARGSIVVLLGCVTGCSSCCSCCFLCAAVADICNCCVAGGGEKGEGGEAGAKTTKGSSGRRTPCPHEPWQRMVNAMLLLTGSITFLYFTLYGLAAERGRDQRAARGEAGGRPALPLLFDNIPRVKPRKVLHFSEFVPLYTHSCRHLVKVIKRLLINS
jgi:hypothetical protein